MENVETVKALYERFLTTPLPYETDVCDSCNRQYSHPINYCVDCPGKIVRVKATPLDYVRSELAKHSTFCDVMGGFAEFYRRETGTVFPREQFAYPGADYYALTNVLRRKLGRTEVKPVETECCGG